MNYTLRLAVEADLHWLASLYENLMRPYVELTHQWDAEKFRQGFHPDQIQIIQVDQQDIGMLKVEQRSQYLYLGDIQIKTDFQNQGLGTQIIQDLIQTAQGFPIQLRVLKGNPAINLYHRLGFEITQELESCYYLKHLG